MNIEATTSSPKRRHRQMIRGIVVSDKMAKTRVIETKRTLNHPLYHKALARKTRIFVHDEKNESKIGDTILVGSTRPISKHKHFSLVKVLEKRV